MKCKHLNLKLTSSDFLKVKDSALTRLIKIINIKIKCDTSTPVENLSINVSGEYINICDFVTFEKDEIRVSPNVEEVATLKVFVLTPNGSSFGDEFFFNVLAETVTNGTTFVSKLSIANRVPVWGIVLKWSEFPFQDEDKLQVAEKFLLFSKEKQTKFQLNHPLLRNTKTYHL